MAPETGPHPAAAVEGLFALLVISGTVALALANAPQPAAPAPAATSQPAQPVTSTYRASEFCGVHGATATEQPRQPLTCTLKGAAWRWEH